MGGTLTVIHLYKCGAFMSSCCISQDFGADFAL
jgi:hypothetical protein